MVKPITKFELAKVKNRCNHEEPKYSDIRQNWFPGFYNALPVYNNMKIKSGTISAVRAFAGYHTASNGKKYVLSIIVNNYDASKGSITPKIFKVLDALR